jgi:AcrR family transcriptional regulator
LNVRFKQTFNQMARHSAPDPRARILDAAEHAFADCGFEGASLRPIVQEARVNLATVYYYFHSKEGLLTAVFQRRFDPLKQEHLDRLRQAEQIARGRRVPVEKILEALVLPPLNLAAQASAQSAITRKLIGRIVTEPNPQTQELVRRQFGEVRQAVFAALRRSLPKLSPADLHWRLEFLWGAMAFILCNPGKIETMSGGLCNPLETPAVAAHLLGFFTSGFHAPAVVARCPPKPLPL